MKKNLETDKRKKEKKRFPVKLKKEGKHMEIE